MSNTLGESRSTPKGHLDTTCRVAEWETLKLKWMQSSKRGKKRLGETLNRKWNAGKPDPNIAKGNPYTPKRDGRGENLNTKYPKP